MNTDVSAIVVDAALKVHKALGPGLLESVYEECLHFELVSRHLPVIRQHPVNITYESIRLDAGFRIDLFVAEQLLIELKSVDKLAPIHEAQILTYLKLSGIKTGLLINFNVSLIKDGIKRYSL